MHTLNSKQINQVSAGFFMSHKALGWGFLAENIATLFCVSTLVNAKDGVTIANVASALYGPKMIGFAVSGVITAIEHFGPGYKKLADEANRVGENLFNTKQEDPSASELAIEDIKN